MGWVTWELARCVCRRVYRTEEIGRSQHPGADRGDSCWMWLFSRNACTRCITCRTRMSSQSRLYSLLHTLELPGGVCYDRAKYWQPIVRTDAGG